MRALVLGLLCALAAFPASSHALDELRLRDGRLEDSRGREVVLRGINVGYKLSPYLPHDGGGVRTSFTPREARMLRSWGWNTVRLIVNWAGLEPEPGRIDHGYIRRYRAMARMAVRAGLYVMVDIHQDEFSEKYKGNGFPEWAALDDGIPFATSTGHPNDYAQPAVGRAFTNFYENEQGVRERFAKAFATLARALRRERGILGYDVFNEPSCEVGTDPCAMPPDFAQGPEAAGRWLQPFLEAVIPVIRRADPRHPVFYEDYFNTAWGYVPYGVGERPNDPWPFRDTGLSFHVYCPHPLGSETPCPEHERNAVDNALANARRNRAWPLITEFGAVDDLRPTEHITELADKLGLSWQFWALKTYDDPHPGFGADSLNPDADGFSLIDKQGNVKEGKLRLLARAYPQRIAGTRPKWSFDPESARFEMRWRPRRRPATVVAIPRSVHYRKGYAVRARGARVVSKRGSWLLRLRGTARRATVLVRPR